jgi:hypothetical protein
MLETVTEHFALILSLCKGLIDLNFCNMFFIQRCWTFLFDLPLERFMSSTLMKLKINIDNFIDCLHLLDGRFDCLSTLIVNVNQIFPFGMEIGGRVSITSMIICSARKTLN